MNEAASRDADAIKSSFSELVAVSEAGDAEAYAKYLTDDAMWLGPGMPGVFGKAAIQDFVSGFFADWLWSFPEWHTEEIIVSGDLAIHRYVGISVSTPKSGGEALREDRKYMDVMRKQLDGKWLLSRHIFNLNR